MAKKFNKIFKGDRKYFAIVFFILVLIFLSGLATPVIVENTENNWQEILSEKITEIENSSVKFYKQKEELLLSNKDEIKERLRDTLSPGYISYGSLIKLVNAEPYKDLSLEVFAPNGKLIAWNENLSISQEELFPLDFPAGETYFNRHKLITFLTVIDTLFVENDLFYFVVGLPVEKHYSLQNSYYEQISFIRELSNKFVTEFDVEYIPFAKQTKDGRKYSFDLLNNDNNKIAVITFTKPSLNTSVSSINSTLATIQSFLVFLAAIFIIPGFKNDFKDIKSRFLKIFLIALFLTLFRYLIFWVGFPSSLLSGKITDPQYFSSTFGGGIVKSPIEFFVTSLFFLVFGIFVFRYSKDFLQKNKKFKNYLTFSIIYFVTFFFFLWIIRGYAATIKSVIFDSTLRYFKDPELIPDFISLVTNFNVLVAGCAIVLILIGFILFTFSFAPQFERKKAIKYFVGLFFVSLLLGILFIYFQRFPLITYPLNIVIIFLLFLLVYQIYFNNLRSIFNYVYITLVASIVSIALLNYFNLELERSSLKTAAIEINRPNDNLLHFLIDETLRESSNDEEIKRALIRRDANFYSTAFILWSKSALQRESLNSSITIYNKYQNKIGEFSVGIDAQFEPLAYLNYNVGNEPFIKEIELDTNRGNRIISGIIPIKDNNNIVLGYITASVGFNTQLFGKSKIPDFLESKKNITNSVIDIDQLKIFEFTGNKLTGVYGDIYPSRDQYEPILSAELSADNETWKNLLINGEGYLTYLMKTSVDNKEKITAVALREKDISWNLFNFFKIFIIHSIYIIILFILLSLTQIRNFKYSFRFQLLVSFLLISIIPVVILAIYNRQVIQERTSATIFNELNERSSYLENHISVQNQKHPEREFIKIFDNAGKELGISFGVYENSEQIFNSKEQYYQAGLFNYKLDPEVYYYMNYLSYREYLTNKEINLYNYNAFFKNINVGNKTFTIGVNDAFNKIKLTFSAIDVDVFLFGVYSFAIIIILIVSTILANRISAPIRKLTKATASVGQGDLNVQIRSAERGEIKELLEGFNSMTRELHKNQIELAEMERESAWKEMAKQVAHEIKNPLTPMKLNVQQLKIAFNDKTKNFENILHKATTALLNQIESLSSIASEFSRFAKMPSIKLEKINIVESIKDTINLFTDEKTRIVLQTEQENIFVEADQSQFKRLFINLIRNSIQAEATKIEIGIKIVNDKIKILVEDNGTGIPQELQDKIFESSFTTKEKGMGIGLKISKRFIEGIGGSISLVKSSDKGTTFKINLPEAKNNS